MFRQRPEGSCNQPYLIGRNPRVGQLIYKMRANALTAEEVAADIDQPLAQVCEVQLYCSIHNDLADREVDEERQCLAATGTELEPDQSPGST